MWPEGETIPFHAAAGGVGQIACQWGAHLGATVIGTTSSPGKVELAQGQWLRIMFCCSAIRIGPRNGPDPIGGEGLPVVYDSIGKDTFEHSLDCLRKRAA